MNLALYGFGDERRRHWIAVDLGVSFAGDDLPGVDLILPDIRYLVEERRNLARHRAHPCARGSFRRAARPVAAAASCRSMRRRSPPRCSKPSARASRGAPDIPVNDRAARRPLHARAVRHRARLGGPFDPGIERADHPHAARHRAAHRRLEDRSDAGHRPADRRGEAARARRRGLPRADRRFHQCGARGPLALGEPTSPRRSPS